MYDFENKNETEVLRDQCLHFVKWSIVKEKEQ